MAGMFFAAHGMANGRPFCKTSTIFGLALYTASRSSCCTPGSVMSLRLLPSPVCSPCSPSTIMTTSACFAAAMALSKLLLSVVFIFVSTINLGSPRATSAPFS
ncbi:hypothetical protein D3C86_1129630 [compost metagenome]